MTKLKSERRTVTRLLTSVSAFALLVGMAACAPPAQESPDSQSDGTVRVGMPGDQTDFLSPIAHFVKPIDTARAIQLYEGLTRYSSDGELEMALAESFESNEDFTEWSVSLRANVPTHSGGTFSADGVIETLSRVLDAESPVTSASMIPFIDLENVEKVDELTVHFTLAEPFSLFPEVWASPQLLFSEWENEEPVGTGMFAPQSFTPGQESTFQRFGEYWGEQPEFETLQILDFPDFSGVTNALRSGQVDIAESVPFADVPGLAELPNVDIIESEHAGQQIFLNMKTDVEPFDDPRVVEAFKLVIDRQTIVDNAFGGYASLGNDYPAYLDGCTPPEIPQREQNIEEAQSLLAEAGASGVSLDLAFGHAPFPGASEVVQIFAQNAADAGLTVNVNTMDPAPFIENWLNWPFSTSAVSQPYVTMMNAVFMPGGSTNAAAFDEPEYVTLSESLLATSDRPEQCSILGQMHQIVHERGGIIVPAYPSVLTAHIDSISGLEPDAYGRTGLQFAGVSIAD